MIATLNQISQVEPSSKTVHVRIRHPLRNTESFCPSFSDNSSTMIEKLEAKQCCMYRNSTRYSHKDHPCKHIRQFSYFCGGSIAMENLPVDEPMHATICTWLFAVYDLAQPLVENISWSKSENHQDSTGLERFIESYTHMPTSIRAAGTTRPNNRHCTVKEFTILTGLANDGVVILH